MTVVSAAQGVGVQVVCDDCGATTSVDGCGLHDAEVVYVAVTANGWAGSLFARGPHRCPDCGGGSERKSAATARSGPRDGGGSRVSVAVTAPAVLVRVTGDIDDDVVPALRSTLDSAMALRPYVIVDLSTAETITSPGLGTLVRARTAVRQRDGELLLAAPSRFVRTVLWTMRLHTAFRMFDTVPQAITAAAAQDSPTRSAGAWTSLAGKHR